MEKFRHVEHRPDAQLLVRWEPLGKAVKCFAESPSPFTVKVHALNTPPPIMDVFAEWVGDTWAAFFRLQGEQWAALTFGDSSFAFVRMSNDALVCGDALGVQVTIERKSK